MGRLFGTDGVRGMANREVTAELALDLAVAAAHVLGEVGAFAGQRPRAIVGRDPRASGEFLSAAVVAGLASAGVDVDDAGVLPTPAVAALVAASGADLGVVLSASHNPMPDNGIKFFAKGGHKLPDEVEDEIERRMGEGWQRPTGADVGRVRPLTEATARYVDLLLRTLPHRLEGLRVVVDCAHGAASVASPARAARGGGGRHRHRGGAGRPQHQRRLRLDAPRPAAARPWWPAPPTSASRMTATPTGVSPWTRPAAKSTATRSWGSSPWRSGSVAPYATTPSSLRS